MISRNLQEKLEKHADEYPRPIKYRDVVKSSLMNQETYWIIGLGFIFFLVGNFVMIAEQGLTQSEKWIGFAVAVLGLFMSLFPLFYTARILPALKYGPLGTALVRKVRYNVASRDTVAATENGIAIGLADVSLPGQRYRVRFEIDSAWASKIVEGSLVDVLGFPGKKYTNQDKEKDVACYLRLNSEGKVGKSLSPQEIKRAQIARIMLTTIVVTIIALFGSLSRIFM